MPRAKASKRSSGARKQSKTAFILQQPADLSAKEVAAKAKASGLAISEGYVYTIRSKAKSGTGEKRGKPGRPKGSKNKPRNASSSSTSSMEAQLQQWVVDFGANAVRAAIDDIAAKLAKFRL